MLGPKVPEWPLPFSPQKFLLLKEYPNKGVLARSKIQKFSSKEQFFQLRSTLFTQVCYLLLKVQYQQRTVYISKNIYQNTHGYLFMLFSYDDSYQDRLQRIARDSLLANIIHFYQLIFGKAGSPDVEEEPFHDYQFREIYQDSESLINYLSELNEKSQDYYFKGLDRNAKVRLPLASPLSILKKLQNSAVFKQYALFFKCDTAVLSKFIESSFSSRNAQVSEIYLQLLDTQKSLFRSTICRYGEQGLRGVFEEYTHLFVHLLKLMQAENYLKLTTLQEDKPEKQRHRIQGLGFEAAFMMNLKKLPYNNKTAEEGSESEGSHQFSIEQKQRSRQKDYLQTLRRFKNQILFRIEVTFDPKNGQLNVAVEGQSQWLIEQLYFNLFNNLWLRFFNLWHSSAAKEKVEGGMQQWELLLRQKHPAIASRCVCKNQSNLVSDIIKLIDGISIAFLLFENVLKNLWKCSQNLMEPPTANLNILQSEHFIAALVELLSAIQQQYRLSEEVLDCIDAKYLRP